MRWYTEVKERCLQQMWSVACTILGTGTPVILELGLVQRQLREAFYARLAPHDYALDVIVLEVPETVRWQRVQQRNTSTDGSRKMLVNEETFALASAAWEAPDEEEIAARSIQLLPN